VVLMPKSFHTERCTVQLKPGEGPALNAAHVILQRTDDYAMKIGMRKLILVPKVLTQLTWEADGEVATVEVQIYNASKQRLRLSKKTNIANVFLPRFPDLLIHRAVASVGEEKAFHAGDAMVLKARLSTKEVKDRMPALVVAGGIKTSFDSSLTVLSGVTVVRQIAMGSTAFVDIGVSNPSSKYIVLNSGAELAEILF